MNFHKIFTFIVSHKSEEKLIAIELIKNIELVILVKDDNVRSKLKWDFEKKFKKSFFFILPNEYNQWKKIIIEPKMILLFSNGDEDWSIDQIVEWDFRHSLITFAYKNNYFWENVSSDFFKVQILSAFNITSFHYSKILRLFLIVEVCMEREFLVYDNDVELRRAMILLRQNGIAFGFFEEFQVEMSGIKKYFLKEEDIATSLNCGIKNYIILNNSLMNDWIKNISLNERTVKSELSFSIPKDRTSLADYKCFIKKKIKYYMTL